MLVVLSYWLVLYNGNDRIFVKLDTKALELVDRFNKEYTTANPFTIKELRDTLYRLNSSFAKLSARKETVYVKDVLKRIGKERLRYEELIGVLASVSYAFGMNFDVFCPVKVSRTFGEIIPIGAMSFYGEIGYICYPLLVIDSYYILSPRNFYKMEEWFSFVRFHSDFVEQDLMEIRGELRGYKLGFYKALKKKVLDGNYTFELFK